MKKLVNSRALAKRVQSLWKARKKQETDQNKNKEMERGLIAEKGLCVYARTSSHH